MTAVTLFLDDLYIECIEVNSHILKFAESELKMAIFYLSIDFILILRFKIVLLSC